MESINSPDTISMDDLPVRSQRLAEIIGTANLIKLSENFGGTSLYIPKPDELMKGQVYKQVIAEFDACPDVKRLAIKHRLSESTVYRLVKHKMQKGKKPIEGQMALE